MADNGVIEITVKGKNGNEPLTPDNFDIKEIKSLFDIVEALLYPNQKIKRAPITYSIEKGSVRNIFKTTPQSAAVFIAIISMVKDNGNLDGLEIETARALSEVQKSAHRTGYTYEFGEYKASEPKLVISHDTSYHVNENLWADAEFYFYGVLVNAGGKDKPNIHIQTKDKGLLIIKTEKEYLEELTENVLYKHFSVRALGRQNIETGELDPTSLVLMELNLHDPSYNAQYLERLIKRATPHWEDVKDVDTWIYNLRGGNG